MFYFQDRVTLSNVAKPNLISFMKLKNKIKCIIKSFLKIVNEVNAIRYKYLRSADYMM